MSLVWNRSAVHRALITISFIFSSAIGFAQEYTEGELVSVQSEKEKQIRGLRLTEIKQIKIAINRRLQKNQAADLYFRLAELYLEAYRGDFIFEGRIYEKRLKAGKKDKTIRRTFSRRHLKNGLNACKKILKLKLKYEKLDRVYYFLAFNYGELGDESESLKYYRQLIKRFPKSQFVPEAYRALGEAEFDKKRFKKAQDIFKKALASAPEDSIVVPSVLHKMAWTYYRTRQSKKAIETMKKAVEAALQSEEKFLSVREEALRDMAIFMTETGQVAQAVKYFDRVAGDKSYYPILLAKLGREYERNLQPRKAVKVYETLVETHPKKEVTFQVLVRLVDIDLRKRKYKRAYDRLAKAFFPDSSDPVTAVSYQNLKSMVRRTASERHEAFRKNKKKRDLLLAESYYELYLDRFLSREDAQKEKPEIQMYLADVKGELGQSSVASDLYRRVLLSRDQRYAKEAGALWVESLAREIQQASKKKQVKGTDRPSELEDRFVSAVDQLVESIPDSREAREADLKAAQVLAGYLRTRDDAKVRCRRIISRSPASAQALTAARLWLQIKTDQAVAEKEEDDKLEALQELEQTIQYLRGNQALMDFDRKKYRGKLASELNQKNKEILESRVKVYDQEKSYSDAGRVYLKLGKDAKKAKDSYRYFNGAIEAFIKDEDTKSVKETLLVWIGKYPKGKKVIEAFRSVATRFFIMGEYEQSAELLDVIGTRRKDPPALATAARILEADGRAEKSRELRKKYLTQYSKSKGRWKVMLELGRSYEKSVRWKEAMAQYSLCMAGPREVSAECGARLADLHLRLKNPRDAKKVFKKIASQRHLKRVKKRKIYSPFVGYARFRLAELEELARKFAPLSLPEKALQKGLAERLGFFEELTKSYQRVLQVGGPWSISALHRLAIWTFNFAEEIDEIKPLGKTKGQALRKFRSSLRGVSGPLRKKAAQTWRDAYRRALRLEILSPDLPAIGDRISDLRIKSPRRAQGFRGKLRLAGTPANGGDIGISRELRSVRARLTQNPNSSNDWVNYGNLLWGTQKPGLAEIAYDRALLIKRRNPLALNNKGVVILSGDQEDWFRANQVIGLFQSALRSKKGFIPAQFNLAALLNYYRLFGRAIPQWKKLKNSGIRSVLDGLGVASLGIGKPEDARDYFQQATEAGLSSSRFSRLYNLAAAANREECESLVDDIDDDEIRGFELESYRRLKAVCED